MEIISAKKKKLSLDFFDLNYGESPCIIKSRVDQVYYIHKLGPFVAYLRPKICVFLVLDLILDLANDF